MKRFLLLLLLPVSSYGAEVLYIQSARAKVLEKPAFTAQVIIELERGTSVIQAESKGRWSRVNTGSVNGWVPRFLLSAQKPSGSTIVLDGGEQALDNSVRRRASVVTTAGAARGLAAEDRSRTSDGTRSDYHALEQMEAISISEEEVARFLAEGFAR